MILVVFWSCNPPYDTKLQFVNNTKENLYVRMAIRSTETDSLIDANPDNWLAYGDYLQPGDIKIYITAGKWESSIEHFPQNGIYFDIFNSKNFSHFIKGEICKDSVQYKRLAYTKSDLEKINWVVNYN